MLFCVQKPFLTKNCFLIAEINLTSWGQLYTCLVEFRISIKFVDLYKILAYPNTKICSTCLIFCVFLTEVYSDSYIHSVPKMQKMMMMDFSNFTQFLLNIWQSWMFQQLHGGSHLRKLENRYSCLLNCSGIGWSGGNFPKFQ